MVIFGATGDLTGRKLMPAIYNLLSQKILPDRFHIVGVARRNMTHDQFRNLMHEALTDHFKPQLDSSVWHKLANNLYYQDGYFEKPETYNKLVHLLATFDKENGACISRFFYLATPPEHYSSILDHLDKSKLSEGCGQGSKKWTKVLIEKPFGKDLETAKQLEYKLSKVFDERQIYRIDHYLAKETIQNILAFRFANTLFKSVWDKDHIDNIQITLSEEGGVGERGNFYEGVGALRDIAQNHLMAMLAYISMEEPVSFTAGDIRTERVRALSALRSIEKEEVGSMVVRGQYSRGMRSGKKIPGYREERNVDPNSNTETYVAAKLFIDNDRWKGMPFYLRTGKRLKSSVVQIDIQFANPQSLIFREYKFPREYHANTLSINIQPKEGITFRFLAKAPGLLMELKPVNMDFLYKRSFKRDIVDSYDKLLIDSIRGDQTLFATGPGFKSTWTLATKIMKGWEALPAPQFPNYSPFSWGPKEADELLQRDGRHWLLH